VNIGVPQNRYEAIANKAAIRLQVKQSGIVVADIPVEFLP
jgi:hypothetical protein